jgi:Amino acid permease
MISILQIATVIISRGDVTLLGEAYAFGVAWSFAMKALAVTVLRFTRPDADRWRVPLNLRLGKWELPIGLMLITTLLFLLAGVNLLTKESATIGGVAFTILFFILLTISERRNAGKKGAGRISERFRLEFRDDLSPKELGVRPGGIVVGVHDPEQLDHLNGVLEHSDPGKQDVILVAVKPGDPAHFQQADEPDQVVGEWEVRVFTTAVAAAEDAGKPVVLVGLVGDRPYGTVLQAARALQSTNGRRRIRARRGGADRKNPV